MDDSVYSLIYFRVQPLPETAMSLACNCLVMPRHILRTYTLRIRDTIIPLVRS